MLWDLRTPVRVVDSATPDAARVLASARAIVALDADDPAPAIALARYGMPLCATWTSGALEYLDGAHGYEPWARAGMVDAVLRALGAPPARIRAQAPPPVAGAAAGDDRPRAGAAGLDRDRDVEPPARLAGLPAAPPRADVSQHRDGRRQQRRHAGRRRRRRVPGHGPVQPRNQQRKPDAAAQRRVRAVARHVRHVPRRRRPLLPRPRRGERRSARTNGRGMREGRLPGAHRRARRERRGDRNGLGPRAQRRPDAQRAADRRTASAT